MPLDEKFKRFREDALTDDQRDRLLAVMRAEIARRGVRLNPDDELLRPLIESEGDATETILAGLEDSLRNAPATSPAITETAPAPGALDVARHYAHDCLDGRIVAGKLQQQACSRFLADLRRPDLVFDPDAADHVCAYLAALGLRLLPFQVFILTNLYGFKLPTGERRYREAYIELARKNGKSTLAGALCLFHLDEVAGDREPNAECYIGSTSKRQSETVTFKAAVRLRNSSEALISRTVAYRSSMACGNSSLTPTPANATKLAGSNVSFMVADEVGDWVDGSLFAVMETGTIARRQPLTFSITTAGADRTGPAWERRQHALQVLDGAAPDDSFFPFICAPDEGDDNLTDESVWAKSNPGIDVLVPSANLRAMVAKAKSLPSTRISTLRYNFNQWPTSLTASSWIEYADLQRPGNVSIIGEEALQPTERAKNAIKRLAGKQCTLGLDLAAVNDLSVLCATFPPDDPNTGTYETLFGAFCPAVDIDKRTKHDKVPYRNWAAAGWIVPTVGETTDYRAIREAVQAFRKVYQVTELSFDPHFAPQLVAELQSLGCPVSECRQGFWLSAALRRIEALMKEGRYCIFGDPCASWMFSNATMEQGTLGDIRLDKRKSRERVDAVAAAASAMHGIMKQPVHNMDPNRFAVRFI